MNKRQIIKTLQAMEADLKTRHWPYIGMCSWLGHMGYNEIQTKAILRELFVDYTGRITKVGLWFEAYDWFTRLQLVRKTLNRLKTK